MKRQKTKSRYRISDELWGKIEPLIPEHPNTHHFDGRPRVSNRKAMDGVLFVLRTPAGLPDQWNGLNETGICSSPVACLPPGVGPEHHP